MGYYYEAKSVEGFVQQLAVGYVARGYWFYSPGRIPKGKPVDGVDRKLLSTYDIAKSKWSRVRQRRRGEARLQYLRHDRFFVLLATPGRHIFFVREKPVLDFRERPLVYGGYSVSSRFCSRSGRNHAVVRICERDYRSLRESLAHLGCQRSAEEIAKLVWALPFEPYAAVRRQTWQILSAINRKRKQQGLAPVPRRCLRTRRRVVSPFADDSAGGHGGRGL